jgi:hypothetical protein
VTGLRKAPLLRPRLRLAQRFDYKRRGRSLIREEWQCSMTIKRSGIGYEPTSR